MTAVQIDPFHRTFGERNFPRGITGQRNARHHGVFQALTERGAGAVKVAAGKILLEGRGAGENTIELPGGSGRIAGDLQRFGEGKSREAERNAYGE